MDSARFVVHDVFDLKARGGLLARGLLEQGAIEVGATLQEIGTGQRTRVIGIEFHSAPLLGKRSYTLVLERRTGLEIRPGSTLETTPEP